jgi:thiamine-phosphate pyrophosphorylase
MKRKIEGLQLIINTDPAPFHSYLDLASKALLGGINSIQFRHKDLYTREIYSIVYQLAEICCRFSVPLIVNDRVDIALSIQAAGVHLGQSDLPIKVARELLGNEKIIGSTASNLEQAKQAEMDGADYVGFGHIYPTTTKIKHHPPVGLDALEQICKYISIPVLAIGGIKEQNIDHVCSTGVSGIALVSAISSSSDPLSQTQKFKKIMDSYGKTTY